jgi:CRP/FNR family transcriptional regulator, nitrogen oxide reductase regulator
MLGTEAITLASSATPRLFTGLSEDETASIVAAGKSRVVERGSVILDQGAPAAHFLMLVAGRARHFYTTPEGEKLLLMWLSPGDCVGCSALLPNSPEYLVSTESLRHSTFLVWDRAAIKQLAQRYFKLWENALSIASDYLDWYITTHVALTCHSAKERLAHVLATLASHIGQETTAGIELQATNEELASAANITSFTACRLLTEWSNDGILSKSRGRVLLLNPSALWRMKSQDSKSL